MSLSILSDLLIVGISVGVLYGLLALSVSMIYASLDIIHFAQGELYTMGAFFGLILFRMNIPFFLSLIFSAIGTAAFAFLLLKTIYDPILRISGGFSVRGLTFVVAGFGMSNILQNTYWVAWGVVSQSYGATFGNGISIGTLTVQPVYFVILLVGIVVMCLLGFLFKKTKIGLAMRAVSYNKELSSIMGINVGVVMALAFCMAAFLSSVSGVLGAQLTYVRYDMAATMLLKAFCSAVIGGMGNMFGAMAGGLIIGVVESIGGFIIGAQYKDVISYVIMVMVLLVRPSGLFKMKTAQKA
ncbi:MAG: branched-chain amino acid ABC transporter permease [Ruthenibacterium sp.]